MSDFNPYAEEHAQQRKVKARVRIAKMKARLDQKRPHLGCVWDGRANKWVDPKAPSESMRLFGIPRGEWARMSPEAKAKKRKAKAKAKR